MLFTVLTAVIVRQYAQDMSNSKPLDEYWDTYQVRGPDVLPPESPLDSPISVRFNRPDPSHRHRAFSDAMVLESSSRPALTPFHPASSLSHFVDSFGPLIFPLYRAALLRKRILLMTEAPVHEPCNYGMMLALLQKKKKNKKQKELIAKQMIQYTIFPY